MSVQTSFNPTIGMEVYTRDRGRLGTVKEVANGRLKVNVRFGRDYWLAVNAILFIDGEMAVMDFDQSEARNFKLEAPPA